jgi:mono/diheme cytochrome c family protein
MTNTTPNDLKTGRFLGFRLGFVLSFAIAAIAVAPTSIVLADRSPPPSLSESRTLNYPVEGEHSVYGAFTGTVSATFSGKRADVTQTMHFADGRSESVSISGRVRGNRVMGRTSTREARGAIQVLQGQAASGARRSQVLKVEFNEQSVQTRLLEGQRRRECLTASASGDLQPEPVDQGLEDEAKEVFHHQTQGLNLVPTGWFRALEQAGNDAMFNEPDHMAGFGFLGDEGSEFPVGFAIQGDYIGLNCSACHTAEIKVFGEPIRIEGGRGNVDLGMFRSALGQSLGATAQTPEKFQRFAARVLTGQGAPVNAEGMQAVGAAVKGYLLKAKARAEVSAQLTPVESGPGRVDAYGAGFNAIFGPLSKSNYRPMDAPTRLPHLWGTGDFMWVQFNGGIRSPLARNLIASVAAGATLPILDENGELLPEAERYKSSSRATDLVALEGAMVQIGAPAYPGYIDQGAAKRGARIYTNSCASCHDAGQWTSSDGLYSERLLELPMIPLETIGTDPNNALAFQRTFDGSALGIGTQPMAAGLKFISDQILAKQGAETSGPNEIRALSAYRARPLDGIWAAAPYLHNGSVLTLDELLGPPAERRSSFKLSTQPELDSERLGLIEPAEGFEFDTSQTGNSNAGHEFRKAPEGTKGVIGRALSEQDRSDLIEFLKTL